MLEYRKDKLFVNQVFTSFLQVFCRFSGEQIGRESWATSSGAAPKLTFDCQWLQVTSKVSTG